MSIGVSRKVASSGLLHQRQLCCRRFAMTGGRSRLAMTIPPSLRTGYPSLRTKRGNAPVKRCSSDYRTHQPIRCRGTGSEARVSRDWADRS
ncbi:MAG: hypothetical protein LBT00_06875 [Spirochaetaceae bacterium]|nr:hypothetical protein [Spirochaetaceae bacterium]